MREKILLVEDNSSLVEILHKFLSILGYEVSVATTGTEAVRMANTQMLDLIILDIMLPEIDGLEVASQIRQNPQTRSVPILAITANVDFGMKIKSHAAGCDAFLHKPFTIKRLADVIERLLKRGGGVKASQPPHQHGKAGEEP